MVLAFVVSVDVVLPRPLFLVMGDNCEERV